MKVESKICFHQLKPYLFDRTNWKTKLWEESKKSSAKVKRGNQILIYMSEVKILWKDFYSCKIVYWVSVDVYTPQIHLLFNRNESKIKVSCCKTKTDCGLYKHMQVLLQPKMSFSGNLFFSFFLDWVYIHITFSDHSIEQSLAIKHWFILEFFTSYSDILVCFSQ